MTLQNIGLLNGMSAKMGFLNKRHELYAQNIANADTPSYRPKDLKTMDFSDYMPKRTQVSGKVRMAATDDLHMPTSRTSGATKSVKQVEVYEAAPDENGVVLEEQLFKATNNTMEYQTMTNLYRRNVGMIRIAINTN